MSKSTSDEFVVLVRYYDLLSHQEQIAQANFDWMTDYDNNLTRKDPTEHLVPVPSGEIEQRITPVHLNRYAERQEIIAEMDTLNVRPALSPEFFALTKAYPDLQRQFPLVGLGSVWVGSDGDRRVLYAGGDSGERNLRLIWDGSGWPGGCRFPAVRKDRQPLAT